MNIPHLTRRAGSDTPVPRFCCRLCGKGFSARAFDFDYWTHRSVSYRRVQDLLVGGFSIRQAGRTLGVSTRLLANRNLRLTRQAIALHSQALEDFYLREAMVVDGFESFAYSQFVLGLHGAPLRRKGRMTERQKLGRALIEETWKAPPNAIYRSCKGLLSWGCDEAFQSRQIPLSLITDEKREYAFVLAKLCLYGGWREDGVVVHTPISSKAARTLTNPLFPVNYLDRQLPKDMAEHERETVRFALG